MDLFEKLCLIVFNLLALIIVGSVGDDQDCYNSYNNNNYGICVPNKSCCKGTVISGICDTYYCCYGRYDCSSPGPAANPGSTSGSCPTIKSRDTWKARNAFQSQPNLSPVRHVFVHQTDSPACDTATTCQTNIRTLQSQQMLNQGFNDIKWNFLIGGDGQVYEGVGWTRQASDIGGWDQKSLGIAFVGNYDRNGPKDSQITALQNLLSCGVSRGYIQYNYQLHGHRDAQQGIQCPGNQLYQRLTYMNNYSAYLDPNY